MGYKCIAPGCNSGYDNNPESFHFYFLVPKDPTIIALWQKAIRRSGETEFCEKKACKTVLNLIML